MLPGKAAWENLRLSEHLRELGFSEDQVMGAAASIIARLVEPSSEHALVQWIPTTALPVELAPVWWTVGVLSGLLVDGF